MTPISSPDHEANLCKEEDPRRLDRGHERAQRRRGRHRRSSEGEPEPLDPLAQIVGVRDVRVEIAVRDPILLPLLFLGWAVVVVGFGFGFALGLGVAPDVEEDFVVEDVPDEAGGPECGACPERGAGEGAGEERGRGGGAEVGADEGGVDDVEGDAGEGDAHVGFGAGGGAEGGEDGAVGVVDEEEGSEEERGGGERGDVGGGGSEGGAGERVDEGDGRHDLHEDPGADAVEEEDAVGGRGKAAKGGIDDEYQGQAERWQHEKRTSDDCKKVLALTRSRRGNLPSYRGCMVWEKGQGS